MNLEKLYDWPIFLARCKGPGQDYLTCRTLSDRFRSLARLSNFTHLRNLCEKSLDVACAAAGFEDASYELSTHPDTVARRKRAAARL